MPALSDPTTWRTHPFSYKGYLFLLDPTVVFEALVNMPGGVSYPIHTFNWDGVISGAYTNVRAGMTVLFGSTRGNDDRGRQRVRLAPTGDDFYIGWSSRGVHDGEVTLFDNTYITVLDDYRVWSKIPYIDESGTAYKDATLQFATNGINPPPVANGGPGYAEFVDPDTNVITVDFDASDSFAVDDGASISTYAWDFDDGTPASSASATASGVTFPPGFRWVHLTVTDSNANSHIAHIPIFAAEKTGTNAPIEDFQVTNQTLTPEGQQISFRILESIPEGTYPDGTLAMYWERERYGSNVGALAGPSGREHMKFIGWHGNENALHGASEEGYLTETTIECVDVVGRLQRLPGFPQIVEREASPASWEEMANANIDRYLHYILHWHSTALDLADFTWSGLGSTYPFTALSSDGQNLYAQADERAQAIAHRLTCDAWGRLWVRPDPQLQDTADRSTTYILDIDETDWSSFEAARQRHPTIHWLHSGAIVASTSEVSAVFCVAPGFAPGQGEGSRDQNYQLVASQSELNTREGHRYARYNSDHGLYTVTIPNRGDAGINPAWMEYVRASISTANAAQRGNSFTDSRFLPMEVDIEHDHEAGTKNYVITVEPFVSGAPAKTEIIETPNFPTWTPPTSTPPPSVYVPGALLPTKLIALMGNGHVAIATSYSHPTAPDWQDATGVMTGDCGSPGATGNEGGYLYEDLWYPARYWVSNSDGLWVNEDPFGGGAWTLHNNDPLLCGVRKLIQSIRQEGWMAAHVAEGSVGGGRVIYSNDNFANIAGTVPYPTASSTYYDITVAQGGRATGAGSGVQLFLLERYVPAPWNLYIVYSGDGGASVARRGTPPGRSTSGFTPSTVSKFTVPVFRNDGSWNTDGDLLYMSAQTMDGATTNVYRSTDGGVTFSTFYDDWGLGGNFANVAAGAMQDNRYQALVLHHADNSRFVYFSSDYGASWYRPPALGINADRIRFSDAWGGINGYSYHNSWFVWWRNQSTLGAPDVFVTDDVGLTASSIQGAGATNLFTVTGQGTGSGSFPNIITVQADISELGWVFQ